MYAPVVGAVKQHALEPRHARRVHDVLFGELKPAPASAHRWLLLHGYTGTCQDWSAWPTEHPAAAIDLPGHGRSEGPSGDFRGEVLRLLDALPPWIDCVAGYSLGGRLALGLIQAAPRRFRRALVISAHPGLRDAGACAARRAQDQRWVSLLRQQGIEAFVDCWERQPLFASQSRLPDEVRAQQHLARLSQRPEGLARALESLGLGEMPDTRHALNTWPGELDWVVGELDEKFVRLGRAVAEQRPATRLHVLSDVGHNPLLEAPEALFRAVF